MQFSIAEKDQKTAKAMTIAISITITGKPKIQQKKTAKTKNKKSRKAQTIRKGRMQPEKKLLAMPMSEPRLSFPCSGRFLEIYYGLVGCIDDRARHKKNMCREYARSVGNVPR